MKGIYLTEEGKQEIEAKIAELEKYTEDVIKIAQIASDETNKTYLGVEFKSKIIIYREILSSATILPVEASWKSAVEGDDDYEHYIENIVCFPSKYPNGVIINSK